MFGIGLPSWGERRRDEKAGASRRRRRRMRMRRRRRQGGGSAPTTPSSGWRADLLGMHSAARPRNYVLNDDLCRSAQARAEVMNRENRMYHERDWWKRIDRTGYRARTCGENLGEGFATAEAVFRAWRNSPAHNRNIMNGEFTEVGFGKSGEYWCAHFGDR